MRTQSILIPLLAAATLLAPLPLPASQLVFKGADAKQRVKDDGYLIFAYADGWDEFSKERCDKLAHDNAIRKAAGEAVIMPLGIPERPNEARKQKQQETLGGLNVPGARSYPAIIMLDKDGNHYATLIGTEISRGSAKEVAKLITEHMEKGKLRRKLIAESEDASKDGPTRARKLAAAYRIDGLSWAGKGFADRLKKLDPKDEAGMVRAWNFNAYGFPHELNKMSLADAMAEVDKRLADPAYSNRQKQQMCAALLGTMRRRAGLPEAEAMRGYAKRMQELDPTTPEGGAAAKILRDWIPGFYYSRGWNPSCVPSEKKAVELNGELPIAEAGTYNVNFQYTSGAMVLTIYGIELYDGKVKVAEDMHQGSTGHSNWQNNYTLNVPKAVKEPHLFITLGQTNRDTNGKITITKK